MKRSLFSVGLLFATANAVLADGFGGQNSVVSHTIDYTSIMNPSGSDDGYAHPGDVNVWSVNSSWSTPNNYYLDPDKVDFCLEGTLIPLLSNGSGAYWGSPIEFDDTVEENLGSNSSGFSAVGGSWYYPTSSSAIGLIIQGEAFIRNRSWGGTGQWEWSDTMVDYYPNL